MPIPRRIPLPLSRRPRNPGARAGFLLPSAVFVGVVVLGLAASYLYMARVQDGRGRRYQATLAARFLAEGVRELVLHLVRDAATPKARPGLGGEADSGFRVVARELPSRLPETLGKYGIKESVKDHRKALDRLFGEGASELVDRLEAEILGASVRLRLGFEIGRFPGAPDWWVDPVAKALEVTVSVEVDQAGFTARTEGATVVVVYPLGAPLVGRFTSNRDWAWHDPKFQLPSRPFAPGRPDGELMEKVGTVEPGSAAKAFADHGWAYPQVVDVLPGGGSLGQHLLLWKPEGGKSPMPEARILLEQPRGAPDGATDPLHPELRQEAFLTGVIQGSGVPPIDSWPGGDLRATIYADDRHPRTVATHGHHSPFGSGVDPSPTFAPASRMRFEARAALVVDRDRSGSDERAQRYETGIDLPRREGVAYELGTAPGEFELLVSEFERAEAGAPAPRLPRVPEAIENRNLTFSDGGAPRILASEAPYAELGLDPAEYALGEVFPDPGEYTRLASRWVEVPLQMACRLGALPLEGSQRLLEEMVWGRRGLDEARAWHETPRQLSHRDPLHKVKERPEDALHFDLGPSTGDPAEDDRDFVEALEEAARFRMHRWQPEIFVFGSEDLERYFPDGDLRGYRVRVLPRALDAAAPVKASELGLKGGTLVAEIVELDGTLPVQSEADPLEVGSANLFLSGGNGAVQVAAMGRLEPLRRRPEDQVEVKGTSYQGDAPIFQDGFPNQEAVAAAIEEIRKRHAGPASLCTVWDAIRDPIGPKADAGYRVAWVGLR